MVQAPLNALLGNLRLRATTLILQCGLMIAAAAVPNGGMPAARQSALRNCQSLPLEEA